MSGVKAVPAVRTAGTLPKRSNGGMSALRVQSRHPFHDILKRAFLAAAVFATCYLVYGRLPIAVLRAESGVYLSWAAGSSQDLLHLVGAGFTKSYNGHIIICSGCALFLGSNRRAARLDASGTDFVATGDDRAHGLLSLAHRICGVAFHGYANPLGGHDDVEPLLAGQSPRWGDE